MAKDLSIFRLANRADLESLEYLGPDSVTVRFRPPLVHSPTSVEVGADMDPHSARVLFDGLPLRYQSDGGPVQPGKFSAEFMGDRTVLRFYETPSEEILVTYSTKEQALYARFSARGRGFRYATKVEVGGVRTSSISVENDTKLTFTVPVSLVPSVVVANTKVLVDLDDSPSPTDIVFDISTRSRLASGTRALIQRFLTILLAPDGANLLALIPKGADLTPQLRSVIMNRVNLAVGLARAKIQSAPQPNAAPEELLSNAYVESVALNEKTNDVEVKVRIVTRGGTAASVPISI